MGWRRSVFILTSLIFNHKISAQFIGGNILTNCPYQNGPLPTLPVNSLQVNNLRPNCACNEATIVNNIANLPTNRYLSPVDRLAYACNQPLANLNTPVGARIANNLPITQCQNQPLTNEIRVIRQQPYNYQNLAGVPINNIVNGPILSPNNHVQNVVSVPLNNLAGLTVNGQEIALNRIANVPIGELANLISNSLPSNKVVRISVNGLANLSANNLRWAVNGIANAPAQNIVAAVPTAGYRIVSIPNERVVTKVPVVSLNSLASLPVYNGMPVLKVSESTYKLTPV